MQRKIRTDKDKKQYEKRVLGKRSIVERIQGSDQRNKLFISLLLGFLILCTISFLLYINFKPLRFKDVIGNDYVRVKWSNNNSLSVEELQTWSLERVYPGSLGENESIQLCFYDEENKLVGNVTFLGHDNLLIHEGKVYQYIEPENKELP